VRDLEVQCESKEFAKTSMRQISRRSRRRASMMVPRWRQTITTFWLLLQEALRGAREAPGTRPQRRAYLAGVNDQTHESLQWNLKSHKNDEDLS